MEEALRIALMVIAGVACDGKSGTELDQCLFFQTTYKMCAPYKGEAKHDCMESYINCGIKLGGVITDPRKCKPYEQVSASTR